MVNVKENSPSHSSLIKRTAFFIIFITLTSLVSSLSSMNDHPIAVGRYGAAPPPPSIPSAAAVSVMTSEEAAERLSDFDPDEIADVLNDVETSHTIDILENFDVETQIEIIKEMLPSASGKVLRGMDVESAVSIIIELDASSAQIIEAMANEDLADTALKIEATVKLLVEGLDETERNRMLEQLASTLEELTIDTLIQLFIEIANLPETPSTVAFLLESMSTEKMLDLVSEWITLKEYSSLINVLSELGSTSLETIYRGMDSAERQDVYPYLSEDLVSSLPSIGEFTVSGLQVSDDSVDPGDPVQVSFTLTNVGEETDDYLISVKVNGVTEETYTGILETGDSTDFSLDLVKNTPGTYNVEVDSLQASFIVKEIIIVIPAEFEVVDIEISPAEVIRGEEITVFVTVRNVGEESGSQVFVMQVDNEDVDSREASLGGGGTSTLIYVLTAAYSEGTHTVSAGDLTKEFVVTRPPLELPWITLFAILVIAAVLTVYLLYQRGLINI
jgi:hypothetical protein